MLKPYRNRSVIKNRTKTVQGFCAVFNCCLYFCAKIKCFVMNKLLIVIWMCLVGFFNVSTDDKRVHLVKTDLDKKKEERSIVTPSFLVSYNDSSIKISSDFIINDVEIKISDIHGDIVYYSINTINSEETIICLADIKRAYLIELEVENSIYYGYFEMT